MTRDQAFKFYEELKKTGKLKEFQTKKPSEMTLKEKELFYFDDGKFLYNPFSGTINEVSPYIDDDNYIPKPLTEERKKALGLYPGMKTKSYAEMTPKEQKLFSDD